MTAPPDFSSVAQSKAGGVSKLLRVEGKQSGPLESVFSPTDAGTQPSCACYSPIQAQTPFLSSLSLVQLKQTTRESLHLSIYKDGTTLQKYHGII